MIGMISAVILYIPESFALSVTETTLIISIILFGMLLGSFAGGSLSDVFGRRLMLGMSEILGCIAAIVGAFSVGTWMLILGRFLTGLAIGTATVVVGLYLAEVSPTRIRGAIQGYGELAGWVGGIASMIIALPIVMNMDNEVSWRLVFLLGAVTYLPAITLTFIFLPESPRWLVLKGRDDEALQLLQRIYGECNQDELEKELRILKTYASHQHAQKTSIKDFWRKENRHGLVITIILHVLQQLCGNNILSHYSSIILHDLGFMREMSIMMTALSMLPQVILIWVIVHNLDSIGRKTPTLVSIAGTAISLVILAAVMQIHPHQVCSHLSLVGIFLNRVFFSIGLGSLPIVISAEILPSAIRGRGLALALALSGFLKIIAVTAFWPIINAAHPAYLYSSLAVIMIIGFIYVAVEMGETMGTPLDATTVEPEQPSGPTE